MYFTFACPVFGSSIFPAGATPVDPAAVFRGANGGVGQSTRLWDGMQVQKKSTTLNEFRTPSLHAINHDKIAPVHNPPLQHKSFTK